MNEQRLLEFIGEIISSSCSENEAVYSLRELKTILEAQNTEPALVKLTDSAIDGLTSDYSVMRRSIHGSVRFTRDWLNTAVSKAREEMQSYHGRC